MSKYTAEDFARGVAAAMKRYGITLDPDEVPGRTITESEYTTIRDEHVGTGAVRSASAFFIVATGLGIAVVPDPEPTNAEKLAGILQVAMQEDGWGDEGEANILAAALEAAGVKAPGGDDE